MSLELLYNGSKIRTFSGKMIDVMNPSPDDIVIEDIAHALSHQCRFGGHTMRFYSVAQHSLAVTAQVPDEHKLAALLHDAAEAYLVDLPTPIKVQMPRYQDVENNLLGVIAAKFGFQYPLPQCVKDADKDALEWEWENIVLSTKAMHYWPHEIKYKFHNAFNHLTNGRK